MTKVGAIIAREMEESEERGRKEGRKEGQEEGRKQGRREARIDAIQIMVEMGLPKEQILKKYSAEEYEEAERMA